MYHIYLDEEAVDAFAQRLVKSERFRDGTYTLYADVPVRCFGYESPYYTSRTNLGTMDDRTAAQTVDFVVTKGTDVVLGITAEVMANKSRKLFEGVLKGIAQIQVPVSGISRSNYRRLYHKVRDFLEEREETPAEGSVFTLSALPADLSEQELKHKCLLNQAGNTSAFGRAHGLFFRLEAGQDDTLLRCPVTSAVVLRDYLTAANWQRTVPEDGNANALQALLDVSIAELFRNHSEEWNVLNDTMAELVKLESYPAYAPEDILENYPVLVHRLLSRHEDGNPENEKIMHLSNQLLRCLAAVLGDERTAERFEVLRMPLRGYFEEAALRSGLYYPEWIYRNSIRPYLNEAQFCGSFTMSGLLKYAVACAEERGTAFPGLYELLVAPLYHPSVLES